VRALAGVVGAALLIAMLVGCGSGSGQAPRLGAGPSVGASINLADCHDWEQATTEERLGTLDQLKNFAGGPVLGGTAAKPEANTGAVLDDEKAYDVLNSFCDRPYAQGFKLYKLYQRAAAFGGAPAQ
jgi:hypothetical protein